VDEALRTVLLLGAEGGSLAILMRPGNPMLFAVQVNDQSLAMIGEGDAVASQSDWVSWEDALARLESYPWRRLYPLTVDSEFAERIMAAVRADARAGSRESLHRWEQLVTDRPAAATDLPSRTSS